MSEPDLSGGVATDDVAFPIPAPSRPPGFLDCLFRVLFAPRAAFRQPTSIPVAYGLIVVILVTALSATRMAVVDLPLYAKLGTEAVAAFAAAQVVAAALSWLLFGAFVALMMELLGGQGRIRDLLAWQGLAVLPRLFETPLVLALRATPRLQWLAGAILGLWSLLLFVAATRATYRVSAARALLGIVLMPVVVGTILITCLAVVGLLAGLSFGIPDPLQFWP